MLKIYISIILMLIIFVVSSCGKEKQLIHDLNRLYKEKGWYIIYSDGGGELNRFFFDKESKVIFANLSSFLGSPSISKSMNKIVYSVSQVTNENSEVAIIDINGNNYRKLFTFRRVRGTSLSPDETKIAFWGDINAANESKNLYLYDCEKNTIILLQKEATYARTAFKPSWSPDSQKIVYSSLDGVISIINIKNFKVEKVVKGDAPTWSPNGRTIIYREGISYFRKLDNITTKYYVEGHKYYAIDPTGKNNRFVFDGRKKTFEYGGSAYAPVVWSPDSKYFIYFRPFDSLTSGPNQAYIYVMDYEMNNSMFIKKLSSVPEFSWHSVAAAPTQ